MLIKKFGDCTIVCDGQCHKAWGINARPREQLSDDIDDYAYLADGELEDAPADPGTCEGGHGKPFAHAREATPEGMNKWCARECERSETFWKGVGQDGDSVPTLSDFNRRVFNFKSRQEAANGQ